MSEAERDPVDRHGAGGHDHGHDHRSLLECDDCVAPAEAFSIVANETRLEILEALWRFDDRPVRFSDLREAVGMRDSAQFNYHLKELTDQFVVRDEDGYDLRHAGEKVVQAVVAGSFNEHPHLEPFEVEDSCVRCGEPLLASYDDEKLALTCTGCGLQHGRYSFPPGGLTDRSREEVLAAFDHRVRHLHCLAADGVCPECAGRMRTEIHREGECCLGVGLRADHVCEQCSHTICSTVGLRLVEQSDVVAFHRDHGVDLGERPYWTLPWCVTDERTTVLDDDPWRLQVEMELEDRLLVTLDGDLDVVEVEHRTA